MDTTVRINHTYYWGNHHCWLYCFLGSNFIFLLLLLLLYQYYCYFYHCTSGTQLSITCSKRNCSYNVDALQNTIYYSKSTTQTPIRSFINTNTSLPLPFVAAQTACQTIPTTFFLYCCTAPLARSLVNETCWLGRVASPIPWLKYVEKLFKLWLQLLQFIILNSTNLL